MSDTYALFLFYVLNSPLTTEEGDIPQDYDIFWLKSALSGIITKSMEQAL